MIDTNNAWPEGVVARYLTVAEAKINITQVPRYIDSDEVLEALAACTGCGARQQCNGRSVDHYDSTELERSTIEARAWAQQHAERCRAIPRPA